MSLTNTDALTDSHNQWRKSALEYIDSLEKQNASQAKALRIATELVTMLEERVKCEKSRN